MQTNRMTRHRSANLKRRRWPRERRGRGGGTGSGIKDVSAQGAWTLASAVSGCVPAGARGGMEKGPSRGMAMGLAKQAGKAAKAGRTRPGCVQERRKRGKEKNASASWAQVFG